MTEAAEQLKPTIAALTNDERLSLADWIYESADERVDPDLLEELERRRMAFENGSSPSRPAEDVIRDMRERFA